MFASFTLCLLAAGQLVADPTQFTPRHDAEVETAARDFRIATYHAFRTERSTYDERIEAGHDLLSRFRRLEETEPHREAVLDWFQQARQVELATLPPLPEFPESPLPKTQPVKNVLPQLPQIEVPELHISTPVMPQLPLEPQVAPAPSAKLHGIGGSLLRAFSEGFSDREPQLKEPETTTLELSEPRIN